jgi:hypothetical protein
MFGRIMDRGNVFPVIFSALLLIILGFWMVSPVFGLELNEKQKNSRPIGERFTAEVRFLRKYGALDHYVTVYERELKLEKNNTPCIYRDIINKLREYESISERI